MHSWTHHSWSWGSLATGQPRWRCSQSSFFTPRDSVCVRKRLTISVYNQDFVHYVRGTRLTTILANFVNGEFNDRIRGIHLTDNTLRFTRHTLIPQWCGGSVKNLRGTISQGTKPHADRFSRASLWVNDVMTLGLLSEITIQSLTPSKSPFTPSKASFTPSLPCLGESTALGRSNPVSEMEPTPLPASPLVCSLSYVKPTANETCEFRFIWASNTWGQQQRGVHPKRSVPMLQQR